MGSKTYCEELLKQLEEIEHNPEIQKALNMKFSSCLEDVDMSVFLSGDWVEGFRQFIKDNGEVVKQFFENSESNLTNDENL